MPTAEQLEIARQNIANYKTLAKRNDALAEENEKWAREFKSAGNPEYAEVYETEGKKYRKTAKEYLDKAKEFEDIVEKDTTVEEDPGLPGGRRRKTRKSKKSKKAKKAKKTRKH